MAILRTEICKLRANLTIFLSMVHNLKGIAKIWTILSAWKISEKMSHLGQGSVEPECIPALIRIYFMEYCPYAQRPRMVLKAKGIPHDAVKINLHKKPEWYFKIHPEGKVPALLDGDKVVVESTDICDYLDETYPENPLYPAEPAAKAKDKELIAKIGPVTGTFAKAMFSDEQKTPEEWLKSFIEVLQPLEDDLKARGTVFFGGEKPGMVDYMLWPWGERAGCLSIKLGGKVPISDDQLPFLRKWRKAMKETPVVKEIYHGPEVFWKLVECKNKGIEPDYDNVI